MQYLRELCDSIGRKLSVFLPVLQVGLCAGWLIAAPPFPFRNPDYQATTGKVSITLLLIDNDKYM